MHSTHAAPAGRVQAWSSAGSFMSWQPAGAMLKHREQCREQPPQLSSRCLPQSMRPPSQRAITQSHTRICQLHPDTSRAHLLDLNVSVEGGRVCSAATILGLGHPHPNGGRGCPTAIPLRRSREKLAARARLLPPTAPAAQPGPFLIPAAAGWRACCSSAKPEWPLHTLCRGATGASRLCCEDAAG